MFLQNPLNRNHIRRLATMPAWSVLILLVFVGNAHAQQPSQAAALPRIGRAFENITLWLDSYDVILRPDKNEPEWWAGAPSVVVDPQGTYWMACRMRTAEGDRGRRGYEIRILRSSDGVHFEKVHSIRREDVPIPGFERPALVRDSRSGKFKLYGCGPWKGGPWGIFKFEDAVSPERFQASTAKLVIGPPEKAYPRDVVPEEYKDPVILAAHGGYHCYVTGYLRGLERIYYFTSSDGETWQPVGDPHNALMPLSGWHDFFVRPASVVPVGVGYLFVYEGSKTDWHDPVYNIATGLGFTFDLNEIRDLTPEAPLMVSKTPSDHFATFRYSHWILNSQEMRVYAEVACPNGTHEIRLYRLPLEVD